VFNWFMPYFPEPLNEQLNPDVTVRYRGVMEKCTFCIQRIHAAEDKAAAEDRPIHDGDMVPACGQACPTDAIVFGDLLDESSVVAGMARSKRAFSLLDSLGTEPAVYYLKGGTSDAS
jgi:Fe-S-cluster-containing dehydrogenase component